MVMRMRTFLPALVLVGGLRLGLPAQEARPVPISNEADNHGVPLNADSEQERIAFMVADGRQQVWAAWRAQGARLARLEKDGAWCVIDLEGLPSTIRALGLARLQDGAVVCLWRDESTASDHLLSRHESDDHVLLDTVAAKLNEPRLLPLEDGGLLVTHRGREIWHWEKTFSGLKVVQLPDDAFWQPEKKEESVSFAEIRAVQHHQGTIWLWSPAMTAQEQLWRLRGVAKWQVDGSATLSFAYKGRRDRPVAVVSPWLNHELAIAVSGEDLRSRDVSSGKETVYQNVDAMRHVERFFEANDRWYLITTPQPDEVSYEMSQTLANNLIVKTRSFYDPAKRSTAVFALKGSELLPLTWKLEREPYFGWWDRPVLATAGGLWLGTREGAVFLPSTEKSAPYAHGSRRVMQLLPAGKDRIIALDESGQTFILPSVPDPAARAAGPTRVQSFITRSLLVQAATGDIWGFLEDGGFHRWEQGAWQKLETPRDVLKMKDHAFVSAPGDQAWLLPMEQGPAAVLDFKSGRWETFATLEDSLQKHLRPAVQLNLRDWPGLAPVASADHPPQIAVLRQSGELKRFANGKWQSWSMSDIAGDGAKATGGPFFDERGRLSIATSHQTWQFEDGRWHSAGESAASQHRLHHSDEALVPPDCPVKDVSSAAYDRHGACWIVDRHQRLWKCVFGQVVAVLQPGEPDPRCGVVYEALTDADGNTFLRTEFGWSGGRYLAVRARLPVPVNTAPTLKTVADTLQIRFDDAAWHVWRIDGGAWSAAVNTRGHRISGLRPGKHALEVLALNADLTPAKKPVQTAFHIEAAADAELDTLLARLGGDDLDASEAAARRLRSQGKSILPLLRARRVQASERQRWWINAILQQLEK